MMRSLVAAALGLVLAAALASPAEARRSLRLVAEGDLAPAVDGEPRSGEFRLTSTVLKDGTVEPEGRFRAAGLNVSRDASGRLPDYRVFLVPPTGVAHDLGSMRVLSSGSASLRLRGVMSFPPSIRALEGGSVEVRLGDVPVLTGTIPVFSIAGAGKSVFVQRVVGDLEGVDRPRGSAGSFSLRSARRGDGSRRDRVAVVSPGLETFATPSSSRPTYRVLLFKESGAAVDVGAMDLELRFGATLFRNSAKGNLSAGAQPLSLFGGGRLEVRIGGKVLLRGSIFHFTDLDDAGQLFRVVRARGTEGLLPGSTDDPARGIVDLRVAVSPARRSARLRVKTVGLDPAKAPYSVVTEDIFDTRRDLGVLKMRPGSSIGVLRFSNRPRGVLPSGGVGALAGHTIEIVDKDGAVALSGLVPTLD